MFIVMKWKWWKILFLAAHHIGHRQHSPGAQVRNSSLRVVIPGPMNNSGLQGNDEISYNEVSIVD